MLSKIFGSHTCLRPRGIWLGSLSSVWCIHSHLFSLPKHPQKGCIQVLCLCRHSWNQMSASIFYPGKIYFKRYVESDEFSFKLSLWKSYYGQWILVRLPWKTYNSLFIFPVRLQRPVLTLANQNFIEHES